MDKVQKFKMMMEKCYGDEFELVLNSIYDGNLEQMFQEFVMRKECYPYSSYKCTLSKCLNYLYIKSKNRKDDK